MPHVSSVFIVFCSHVSAWLIIAGVLSILLVISLAGVALFSVLHVAMQLQRREIMVSFQVGTPPINYSVQASLTMTFRAIQRVCNFLYIVKPLRQLFE